MVPCGITLPQKPPLAFFFCSLHTGGVNWSSCVGLLGSADTKQLWLGIGLGLACLLGLVIRSETAMVGFGTVLCTLQEWLDWRIICLFARTLGFYHL
jgi:hypothetical protein